MFLMLYTYSDRKQYNTVVVSRTTAVLYSTVVCVVLTSLQLAHAQTLLPHFRHDLTHLARRQQLAVLPSPSLPPLFLLVDSCRLLRIIRNTVNLRMKHILIAS